MGLFAESRYLNVNPLPLERGKHNRSRRAKIARPEPSPSWMPQKIYHIERLATDPVNSIGPDRGRWVFWFSHRTHSDGQGLLGRPGVAMASGLSFLAAAFKTSFPIRPDGAGIEPGNARPVWQLSGGNLAKGELMVKT